MWQLLYYTLSLRRVVSLEYSRQSLPNPHTERSEPEPLLPTLEGANERHGDARAAASEWVSQGEGAARLVQDGAGDAEQALTHQDLGPAQPEGRGGRYCFMMVI